MVCLSCNARLTPFEATRRYKSTGEFMDLCNRCFAPIEKEVSVTIRKDLAKDHHDYDLEDDDWQEVEDIDYDDR